MYSICSQGHICQECAMENPLPLFTKREVDILAGLVAGKSNKEIGWPMGITERTVKAYIANIGRRLSIVRDGTRMLGANRVQIAVKLIELTKDLPIARIALGLETHQSTKENEIEENSLVVAAGLS